MGKLGEDMRSIQMESWLPQKLPDEDLKVTVNP